MMNLIQLLTDQRIYGGITHSRWGASWNWRWRRVGDDEEQRSPSPEPQTDSRSALPREIMAWRRLHIVKRDDFFSLIFSPRKQLYRVGVGVGRSPRGPRGRVARPGGGGRPHPREKGVGPLVFIFGEDFLLFIVRYSVEFQVIPRTFVFYT